MNYRVSVAPSAQADVKRLPGHVRQRVRGSISALSTEPRPARAKRLRFDASSFEVWRLRIDGWRVLYAIFESDPRRVAVIAVRRRPPYAYGDLEELFSGLSG